MTYFAAAKKFAALENIISIYFCSQTIDQSMRQVSMAWKREIITVMQNGERGFKHYKSPAHWERDGGKKERRTEVKHKLLMAEMEPLCWLRRGRWWEEWDE